MAESSPQATSIIDRLDRALDHMATQLGLKPAAIYLTPQDYDLFAAEHTRVWRSATGSTAMLWPCSHDDVPLINEKLIDRFEIPVRQRIGARGNERSTVYASNGTGVPLGFDE